MDAQGQMAKLEAVTIPQRIQETQKPFGQVVAPKVQSYQGWSAMQQRGDASTSFLIKRGATHGHCLHSFPVCLTEPLVDLHQRQEVFGSEEKGQHIMAKVWERMERGSRRGHGPWMMQGEVEVEMEVG